MKPFRSTQTQRDDLNKIKKLLFEKGYRIFTPIERFKRNTHDFLAIRHNECHLLQIGRCGIEVRSYSTVLPHNRESFIKRKGLKTGLRYRRQLPWFAEDDWKGFIIEKQHSEYDEMKKRVTVR